jgi:hypothetical protein
MAVIIFRLKDAPEDEIEEIRDMLTEGGFDFYETTAGKWGTSVAAFWLKDDAEMARARALIDAYQAKRLEQVQGEHARLREQGELESFFTRLAHYPLQILAYILLVLLVIYLTVVPFISL